VTFLIEYPDPEVRRVQLEKLRGIEDRCWVQVSGFDRVFAIADEDLEDHIVQWPALLPKRARLKKRPKP
jgi:hypothetical protein